MDWKKMITGFIIYALFATQAIAQDSLPKNPEKPSIQDNKIKSRGYTKKQNLQQLDQALENNDQEKIAEQYVKLAGENKKQNEHSKAIHNLQQALSIYTKLKDKKNISQVNRKIAQIQEAQNKDQEAILSYSKAEENAVDVSEERANNNDIRRLSQKNDIEVQRNYNISNAQLFESEGNTNEAVRTYQLQADLELKHNNIDEAKRTLEQAAVITRDKKQKTEIEQKLATVLAKDRQYQDAIMLSKKNPSGGHRQQQYYPTDRSVIPTFRLLYTTKQSGLCHSVSQPGLRPVYSASPDQRSPEHYPVHSRII